MVEIPLARGVLRAVDGASFDVLPAEALGIVGESGSGKTMALRALLGLLPRKARIAGGSIEFEGEDLVRRLGDDAARSCAGASVAMIFQEPMTALNPVMRVGEQIAETPLVRLGLQPKRRAKERALELMRLVGIPDPARRDDGVPARAVGRHAPARDDRDRALGRPEADPLRRADDGARRDDPGPDPEAAARRCGRSSGSASSSSRTISR